MKIKKCALSMAALLLGLCASCDKTPAPAGTPTLADVTTIVGSTETITSSAMGDWIAIRGKNLEGATSIRFNDVEVDMEEIYYEGGVLYLQVPVKVPMTVTDKLTVTTPGGVTSLDFVVEVPALELTGMFNEYTPAGETIKIYGKFLDLYEIDGENTFIMFGDVATPVLENHGNYLLAVVPENAPDNVRVKAVNSKYNATATCPGWYRDKQYMITNFDDDYPYRGRDQAMSIEELIGEWTKPAPISGKFMRLKFDATTHPEGLNWWFLMDNNPCTFEKEMLTNPEKYLLKFELNMLLLTVRTIFIFRHHWDGPGESYKHTLSTQKLDQWQTITIPLEELFVKGRRDGSKLDWNFNIRVESGSKDANPVSPAESVEMYFDNFRISKREE